MHVVAGGCFSCLSESEMVQDGFTNMKFHTVFLFILKSINGLHIDRMHIAHAKHTVLKLLHQNSCFSQIRPALHSPLAISFHFPSS